MKRGVRLQERKAEEEILERTRKSSQNHKAGPKSWSGSSDGNADGEKQPVENIRIKHLAR